MKYTKPALKEELRKRGLLTEGDKPTLALRLQIHFEQMNQLNPAELLADVEISTEQVDTVNEENANSIEREQELESLKQELEKYKHEKESLQEELASVKRELDSVKGKLNQTQNEKNLLQENFNSLQGRYQRLQRQLNQNNMPLSSEVRPSISSVTSTTSREMLGEFNRRNSCK